MLYTDMIKKMDSTLNKLNHFTGSVIASPTMIQNNGTKVEAYETGILLTSRGHTSSGHTFQITSSLDHSHFCVNNSIKSPVQLHVLETHQRTNINTRCIFCNISCAGYCCSQCSEMNRGLKFKRLRQLLEKCSKSDMCDDEIDLVVKKIQQVNSLI